MWVPCDRMRRGKKKEEGEKRERWNEERSMALDRFRWSSSLLFLLLEKTESSLSHAQLTTADMMSVGASSSSRVLRSREKEREERSHERQQGRFVKVKVVVRRFSFDLDCALSFFTFKKPQVFTAASAAAAASSPAAGGTAAADIAAAAEKQKSPKRAKRPIPSSSPRACSSPRALRAARASEPARRRMRPG